MAVALLEEWGRSKPKRLRDVEVDRYLSIPAQATSYQGRRTHRGSDVRALARGRSAEQFGP